MPDLQPVRKKADLLPAPVLALVQTLLPDCTTLLPPDIALDHFRAALWLELTGRPQLAECSVPSLREAIVQAAMQGMLPGRDCHLLPFREKDKGQRRATFVANYFGVIRGLYRTGMVEQAFAEVVYQHDVFDLDYGRPQALIHKPPRGARGRPEGAYGFILVRGNTHPLVHYMPEVDLNRVRDKAPAHDHGPWVSDPQEMWRKTALKNVAKYARLTPQLQQLLLDDDARQREDIPVERHLKNLEDAFSPDPRGSTPTQAPPVRPREPAVAASPAEIVEPAIAHLQSEIDALLAAQGVGDAERARWWQSKAGQLSPGHLSYLLEQLQTTGGAAPPTMEPPEPVGEEDDPLQFE